MHSASGSLIVRTISTSKRPDIALLKMSGVGLTRFYQERASEAIDSDFTAVGFNFSIIGMGNAAFL